MGCVVNELSQWMAAASSSPSSRAVLVSVLHRLFVSLFGPLDARSGWSTTPSRARGRSARTARTSIASDRVAGRGAGAGGGWAGARAALRRWTRSRSGCSRCAGGISLRHRSVAGLHGQPRRCRSAAAGGLRALGAHGHSQGPRRPDLRQMVLAVVLDGEGRPVCTEMPGGQCRRHDGAVAPSCRPEALASAVGIEPGVRGGGRGA